MTSIRGKGDFCHICLYQDFQDEQNKPFNFKSIGGYVLVTCSLTDFSFCSSLNPVNPDTDERCSRTNMPRTKCLSILFMCTHPSSVIKPPNPHFIHENKVLAIYSTIIWLYGLVCMLVVYRALIYK